ncbi:hypothetical protein LK994_04955 [Ferruginibacter lapsinanis]|uniref:hypothetical protein n=1 Tax=Ferruginibacter lapsinanis TaxID=563172 RepID=UPI001E490DD5|nr:hypothetical protein [Ferruginibacter lapsinanis]UEG50823.1 hypothetical protein LK994_04955 [Ferruginibacter lapsinanis]
MKWVLVNNHHSPLQEYHLMDEETCRVVIKYNPRQHSARITCGIHQRLFFIETTGSLKQKTVFTNEYGLEIGSLTPDSFTGGNGLVTINEKKYNYSLNNNPLAELIIYDKDMSEPLVSCGLETSNSITKIALSNNTDSSDNSCLLLGLCWYLFLPVVKENVAEYAA